MARRYGRRLPPRARPVLALAVGLTVLLGGGAAALLESVPAMAYAARWTGTPGFFDVQSCTVVDKRTQCWGTFRADGGAPPVAASMSQPFHAGQVVPVQRTAGGDCVPVGAAAFFGWLAVALFGALLAGTGVMVGLAVTGCPRPRIGWAAVLTAGCGALLSALVAAVAHALS